MVLDKAEPAREHVGVFERWGNVNWNDAINTAAGTDCVNPSLHFTNIATKRFHPIGGGIANKKSRRAVPNDNPQSIVHAQESRLNSKQKHTERMTNVKR